MAAVQVAVSPIASKSERRREVALVLLLVLVVLPVATVMVVGGYGFAVLMTQLFAGPPVA